MSYTEEGLNRPMTYKKFWETCRKTGVWTSYIVTLERYLNRMADGTIQREYIAVVLRWMEDSKWYAAEPFDGYKEVGYTDQVRLHDHNWKVVDIRCV